MTYTIIHDKDKCIGCGACTAICPNNWKMKPNGKAENIKKQIDDKEFECNKEAADACPVNVIHIKDEKDNKII